MRAGSKIRREWKREVVELLGSVGVPKAADGAGSFEVDRMFDQYADVMGARFDPAVLDFAEVESPGAFEFHERPFLGWRLSVKR
jgi:hypothetical protein